MITDYASLQTELASWLNRGDLTGDIPTFIQLAEQKFRRNRGLRRLVDRPQFVVGQDYVQLPGDFDSIQSLYHEGPVYYGPIAIVNPSDLAERKRIVGGATGVPTMAAVVDPTHLRFAPVPDQAYTMHLTYWCKIVALSDQNTTNWLLLAHPDLYLYGALMVAAPFLKDDERIVMWQALHDTALAEAALEQSDLHFSGSMAMKPRRSAP